MDEVLFLNKLNLVEQKLDAVLTYLQKISLEQSEELSVRDFARITGRTPTYITELCRDGRLMFRESTKRSGPHRQYVFDRAELDRYRRDGPLMKVG